VQFANSTCYGLSSYIRSRDLTRARRIAAELEAGEVLINGAPNLAAHRPFGGIGISGVGKEGGGKLQAVLLHVVDTDPRQWCCGILWSDPHGRHLLTQCGTIQASIVDGRSTRIHLPGSSAPLKSGTPTRSPGNTGTGIHPGPQRRHLSVRNKKPNYPNGRWRLLPRSLLLPIR
jgi:hypothetical protein